MRSIVINNEFISSKELELGKKYKISDDFYYGLEGILVNISNHFVCTDGDDISVHEVKNILIRLEDTWDERRLLIDDISEIEEIA